MKTKFACAPLLAAVVIAAFAACSSSSNGAGKTGGSAIDGGGENPDGSSSQTGEGGTNPDGSTTQNGDGSTATGPDGSTTPPPVDPYTVTPYTVSAAGISRTYSLSVPNDYDATKTYPLVIALHGDGESGSNLRSFFEFESLSGAGDAVITAYPDGQNGTWDLYDADPSNPDFAFMKALITDVASKAAIDQTRVFAVGWSNGGFFANELACNEPGLVAAIASNSGGEPAMAPLQYSNSYPKCVNGEKPTPLFVVNGTADGTVGPQSGYYDGVYWAYVNGCAQTTTATTPTPCVSYDSCPTGEDVVDCEIPGMGHQIWSGTAAGAWAFFQHEKP